MYLVLPAFTAKPTYLKHLLTYLHFFLCSDNIAYYIYIVHITQYLMDAIHIHSQVSFLYRPNGIFQSKIK